VRPLWIAVVCGAALALLPVWMRTPQPTPAPTAAAAAPAEAAAEPAARESTRAAIDTPGLVRIVLDPPANDGAEPRADAGSLDVVAEFEHIGKLSDQSLENFAAAFAQQAQLSRARLDSAGADASDSAALLEEARSLLSAARFEASIAALRAGSYITTASGAETPSLALPGLEVAQVPSHVNGQRVTVTILMAEKEHPQLAAARRYYEGLQDFDDSERARRFNSLPDDHRLALVRRITSILNNPNASSDDRRWVYDQIGYTNRLDAHAGILLTR
jgi:hypothetical protein